MELENILTGNIEEFESLDTFESIPIFNGTVTTPRDEDRLYDMQFAISLDNGVIQLINMPNLSDVYQGQTTTAIIGDMWKNHHHTFGDLIGKYKPTNVLEFGGAHGYLADYCLNKQLVDNWCIVEPNPVVNNKRIKVINDYFDPAKHISSQVDCVVSSHVFEHLQKPFQISRKISERLPVDGLMFAAIPNLALWVEKGQPNALNFEHIYLLTDTHFEDLMNSTGFKVLEKIYFGEGHSIFYVLHKTSDTTQTRIELHNLYDVNRKRYDHYYKSFSTAANRLKKKVLQHKNQSSKTYIFGAHLFTQFLLAFGLSEELFDNVLDNNRSKQNQRLYGTNLISLIPDVISNESNPIVVLRAGSYDKEIKEQLLTINKSTIVVS